VYIDSFHRRVEKEWLPRYLDDCGYEPGGYSRPQDELADLDAKWFLRAIDEPVVDLLPKARLKLPASSVKAAIFWEHSKAITPRPITLHIEGVLSAGMAARLHVEYGWPIARLGFEYPPGERIPGRRAFDLGALSSEGILVLAGEAKKSARELDHVLKVIQECGAQGEHMHDPEEKGVTNGHRKWQGLVRCRPEIFFTFGPAEDWSIFAASYGPNGEVDLGTAGRDALQFRERRGAEGNDARRARAPR